MWSDQVKDLIIVVRVVVLSQAPPTVPHPNPPLSYPPPSSLSETTSTTAPTTITATTETTSAMAATLDPKGWSKWFVSDAPQVYSPEPLHSPNGFVLVPPLYDFPADIPFPPAPAIPLPVSPPSSKKLRKSVVIPASPPKLPPLSFTPDDPSPSHSMHTSPSRLSLLRKNPPPPPQYPTSQRRLTKRRPSLPAIQSSSYAYLAEQQPPPVSPLTSSPTSPASASAPTRSRSDPTHSSTEPSAPVQRASSLMTIRGFSLRRRKARALVDKDRLATSRWGVGIRPARSSASDSGHSPPRGAKEKNWLPFLSITPFDVNLPPPSVSPPQLTLSALGPDTPPSSSANGSSQHLPWVSDFTGNLSTNGEPPSPPPKRAKFTLSPESPTRPPPTSYYAFSSPPCTINHSSQDDHPSRPPLVRRDARTWTSHRRWTLAMAMTDEGITDEVLVEELEKMRLRRDCSGENLDKGWGVWEPGGGWAGSQSAQGPGNNAEDSGRPCAEDGGIHDSHEGSSRTRRDSWKGDVYGGPREDVDDTSPPTASAFPSTPSLPHIPHPPSSSHAFPPLGQGRNPRSSTTPTATWTTARRALLTCRELVRTERHYLASLQSLVAGHTVSVPPPLMLRYAAELIGASVRLLRRMEEDPSAWGVAVAFLAAEEEVEGAFVAWCGVVGEWFEGSGGGDDVRAPKRKGSKVNVNAEEEGSPLRRTVSTWRRSFPSIPSLTLSVGATPLSPSAFSNRRKEKEREAPAVRSKPPVRDLAILPTQRVMRYVLLYRDLFAHTPATSPSRALVERAVEAACRIAQKCDRAQGNSAFLQRR